MHLMRDVLECRDEVLLIALRKYKPKGNSKQEQREDVVKLMQSHYNLKQQAESWPIPLEYQLGGMKLLNQKIALYQGVVDLNNDLNQLVE